MKRLLVLSLLLTMAVIGSSLLLRRDMTTEKAEETPEASAEVLSADAERSIKVLCGEEVKEMTVYDYLVQVVAAEMPVSFEPEALKAQAVAARTYLQRSLADGKHENADICAAYDCCQAFISYDMLKSKWGKNYDLYIKKITEAVSETDGQYISYEGKPALAAFHSSSAGKTEDSAAVWNPLPYLVSVDSPEKADDVPNYVSTVKSTDLDFRDTILCIMPEADMTGEAESWTGEIKRSGSGRVESIEIGGKEISGKKLREAFSLRSTAFELEHKDGQFVFTVTGYGHGVGMSQYGANAMAKDGCDYREILEHYYPGTVLS